MDYDHLLQGYYGYVNQVIGNGDAKLVETHLAEWDSELFARRSVSGIRIKNMTKYEKLGETEAIRVAESDGIILHQFTDPINGGQDALIIRRNTRINNIPDVFELFLETSTGGCLACPELNTGEMNDFLDGTGLNQEQLVDLCDGFDLW